MLHEKKLFNAKEQDKFTDIYYELGKNLMLSEVVKMISGEPLLEKEEMKIDEFIAMMQEKIASKSLH